MSQSRNAGNKAAPILKHALSPKGAPVKPATGMKPLPAHAVSGAARQPFSSGAGVSAPKAAQKPFSFANSTPVRALASYVKKEETYHSIANSLVGAVFGAGLLTFLVGKELKKAADEASKKDSSYEKMYGFNDELIGLVRDFENLISKVDEFRQEVTIYTGITPKMLKQIDSFESDAEKLIDKIETLKRRKDFFIEDANRNGIKIDHIKSLANAFDSSREYLKRDLYRSLEVTKMMKFIYHGDDKQRSELLDYLMYRFVVEGEVASYYFEWKKEALSKNADIEAKKHLAQVMGPIFLPSGGIEEADIYDVRVAYLKDRMYRVMDTALLAATESSDFKSAKDIMRFSYENLSLDPDEIPHFITNRFASHLLRCAANNLKFDYELASVVARGVKVEGKNDYEKWNFLVRHFNEKTKEKNPNNGGIYNFYGVIAIREVKKLSIVKYQKDKTPAEKALAEEERLKMCNKALGYYKQAIACSIDNPVYYANRSEVYIAMGEYGKAMSDIEIALSKDPEGLLANFRKADILHSQGEFKKARDQLDKVHIFPFSNHKPGEKPIIPENINYVLERHFSHVMAKILWDGARDYYDYDMARHYASEAVELSSRSGITAAAAADLDTDPETQQFFDRISKPTLGERLFRKSKPLTNIVSAAIYDRISGPTLEERLLRKSKPSTNVVSATTPPKDKAVPKPPSR